MFIYTVLKTLEEKERKITRMFISVIKKEILFACAIITSTAST